MSHCYHGPVDMADGVYYKLMRMHRTGLITVVCLQWFDEFDYDEKSFIRNSSDEIHVFDDEDAAIDKMNQWFKPDEIETEYRRSLMVDNVRD